MNFTDYYNYTYEEKSLSNWKKQDFFGYIITVGWNLEPFSKLSLKQLRDLFLYKSGVRLIGKYQKVTDMYRLDTDKSEMECIMDLAQEELKQEAKEKYIKELCSKFKVGDIFYGKFNTSKDPQLWQILEIDTKTATAKALNVFDSRYNHNRWETYFNLRGCEKYF